MRALRVLLPVLALLLNAGCGRAPKAEDLQYRVLSWNLGGLGLRDRDGDGQANDPPSPDELAAVAALIASRDAEIVALQGMGGPGPFEALRAGLEEQASYPFHALLDRGAGNNLALLSRFPIERHAHTNLTFTIGGQAIPVTRGFQEIQVGYPAGSVGAGEGWSLLRLVNVHLKSKDFHAAGQNEIRRNETRLLDRLVRGLREAHPKEALLVCGTLNDAPASQTLRKLGDDPDGMRMLNPADVRGLRWTHVDRETDTCTRRDYLLVDEQLERQHIAVSVVDHEAASPHRAVEVVLPIPK